MHNVVTYMEAHRAPLTDSGRTTDRLSKSVRFYAHTASDADNDDSSDSEESPTHSSRSFSPSNGRREKQSIRKIKTATSTSETKSTYNTNNSLTQKEIDFIHCLVASAERETSDSSPKINRKLYHGLRIKCSSMVK